MAEIRRVSYFDQLETAKPDPVFNVLVKFKEDRDQNKVNLSVGGMHFCLLVIIMNVSLFFCHSLP